MQKLKLLLKLDQDHCGWIGWNHGNLNRRLVEIRNGAAITRSPGGWMPTMRRRELAISILFALHTYHGHDFPETIKKRAVLMRMSGRFPH